MPGWRWSGKLYRSLNGFGYMYVLSKSYIFSFEIMIVGMDYFKPDSPFLVCMNRHKYGYSSDICMESGNKQLSTRSMRKGNYLKVLSSEMDPAEIRLIR